MTSSEIQPTNVIVGVLTELQADLVDFLQLFAEQCGLDAAIQRSWMEFVSLFDRRKQYGRHRSFIRLISNHLPVHPVTRVSFHTASLASSSEAVASLETSVWSLEDVDAAWHGLCKEDTTLTIAQRSSTPVPSSIRNDTSLSGEATNRIQALEEELERLRRQVANIITVQETGAQLTSDYGSMEFGLSENDRTLHHSSLIAVSSTGVVAPLPPPPPPPPPPIPLLIIQTPETPANCISLSEQLSRQVLRSNRQVEEEEEELSQKPFDMKDILKGLKTVRLRHVARSPGGTPLRTRSPLREENSNMLVAALKRRFSSLHPVTSEDDDNDQENDPLGLDSFDTSPAKSPACQKLIFGQHMLKPASLKTKMASTVTPLKENSANVPVLRNMR